MSLPKSYEISSIAETMSRWVGPSVGLNKPLIYTALEEFEKKDLISI